MPKVQVPNTGSQLQYLQNFLKKRWDVSFKQQCLIYVMPSCLGACQDSYILNNIEQQLKISDQMGQPVGIYV